MIDVTGFVARKSMVEVAGFVARKSMVEGLSRGYQCWRYCACRFLWSNPWPFANFLSTVLFPVPTSCGEPFPELVSSAFFYQYKEGEVPFDTFFKSGLNWAGMGETLEKA